MYKKKSLGQHFLKDAKYLRAAADAADITKGERVVEIGPGHGALTRELLARGARVIALEKDSRLVPLLHAAFDKETHDGSLEIIEGDALEWEAETEEYSIPADPASQNSSGRPNRPSRILSSGVGLHYKVVGNIPYYITGALLRKFLSAPEQPSRLVFLIQKEVAERIARLKKESILSLSIKAYGTPTYITSVPRGAFSPAPGVDSAILAVTGVSRHNFINAAHEEKFFALVRAGFGQKRKLLRRNLETLLGAETEALMLQAGIAPGARAEDVPLENWLELAKLQLG